MSTAQNLLAQLQQGNIGQWYVAKSQTDRLIIKILVALIVGTTVYTAVWKPVSYYNQDQQARYVTELTLYEWIILNQATLSQRARQPISSNNSSALIPSITTAANQNQIKLDRLQPTSDGGVSVSLQDQQFDQVLKWLSSLENRQGLILERLAIDRSDESSRVSGQVKLLKPQKAI